MPGANEGQVGGEHYKKFNIQPWDAIADWELDYFAGSAVAYLARYKHKGDSLGDLKKAKHYIEKLMELEICAAQSSICGVNMGFGYKCTLDKNHTGCHDSDL